MSELQLHITKAGLLTSVQDAGRPGYGAFGVPLGGAADRGAMRMANWLVGNAPDAPVLEITWVGPTIRLEGEGQIALCGADLSAKLNNQELPMYRTISVSGPAELSFGALKSGCRAYLAVRGDWQLTPWLGSYSAAAQQAMKLTPKSVIQKGSELIVSVENQIDLRDISPDFWPEHSRQLRLRVLPGSELSQLPATCIGYFFSRGFRISKETNRMGCRLEQTVPNYEAGPELISSAVVPGTVQLTGSGQPIVLMPDAQTTGGYPRIAHVISADLDALAQAKPGDELWFSLVTLEEASAALRERIAHFEELFKA